MDEAERKHILARFLLFFDGTSPANLAGLLGLSERQVKRLQASQTPQVETAERMKRLLDDALEHAVLSPAQRLEIAERRRAAAEDAQRITRPTVIDGLEDKEVPPWYANVRRLLDAGRWDEARERIQERLDDPQDWARVPAKTQAYVLLDHGVCHHKTGRFPAAADFAGRAIAARASRHPPQPSNMERVSFDRFMAIAHSNLGCSRMQLGDFEEAHRLFKLAIEFKPDLGTSYYNAVCAASLAHDAMLLTHKLGGMVNAARTLLQADDILEIVRDAAEDRDLAFARQQPIFLATLDEIGQLAERRRSGTLRPALNPEGPTS